MSSKMDAYTEKQRGIYYNAFRQPMAQPELQLTGANPPADSGLLLILRYPDSLTRLLSQASANIGQIIPAMSYGADTLHTTLATGSKLTQRTENEANALEIQANQWFMNQGQPLAQTRLANVCIGFTDWLYNSNTLIAASKANAGFWQLAEALVESAQQAGIELSMPWGSHITVSRFLAEQQSADIIRHTVSELPPLPWEPITPCGIELVRFQCDADGFHFFRREDWSC
ncbi:hypothetical protein Q4551_15470 [Oceanobacter sp. 5_MG-2023]|uniref:hypothetical protein n=1 Tax=Oceanobacter sp. 5_MG-2023 TaxID=3062645 RepID=UPI0026E3AAE7|nr:hypothetical protein [Oceanobacter sp. 5_MG-2023]MDO6683690.1 hypothetical protein [Oceanobacter sp. 5_MG-2023]